MSGLGSVTHWEFAGESKLSTSLTEVEQADTFPRRVCISEVFTETLSPACHTAAELSAPEFGSKVSLLRVHELFSKALMWKTPVHIR